MLWVPLLLVALVQRRSVQGLRIAPQGDGEHEVVHGALSLSRYKVFEERLAELHMFEEPIARKRRVSSQSKAQCNTTSTIFGDIPKLLHTTWKSTDQLFMSWYEEWTNMNPDFKVCFWSDNEAFDFIQEYAPQDAPMLDAMKPIEKFDYFRYLLMLKLGGVYTDIDALPAAGAPISTWGSPGARLITGWEIRLQDDEAGRKLHFCGKDQLQQWTIAAAPEEQVFVDVLELIREKYAKGLTSHPVHFTGPCTWSEAVFASVGELPPMTHYGNGPANEVDRDGILICQRERFAQVGYPSSLDIGFGTPFVHHHFLGSWKNAQVLDERE